MFFTTNYNSSLTIDENYNNYYFETFSSDRDDYYCYCNIDQEIPKYMICEATTSSGKKNIVLMLTPYGHFVKNS